MLFPLRLVMRQAYAYTSCSYRTGAMKFIKSKLKCKVKCCVGIVNLLLTSKRFEVFKNIVFALVDYALTA